MNIKMIKERLDNIDYDVNVPLSVVERFVKDYQITNEEDDILSDLYYEWAYEISEKINGKIADKELALWAISFNERASFELFCSNGNELEAVINDKKLCVSSSWSMNDEHIKFIVGYYD